MCLFINGNLGYPVLGLAVTRSQFVTGLFRPYAPLSTNAQDNDCISHQVKLHYSHMYLVAL